MALSPISSSHPKCNKNNKPLFETHDADDNEEEEDGPLVSSMNDGRIYKCGMVPPNSNKLQTIPLLHYLCTSPKICRRDFQENAWKRRILRGQIFVDSAIIQDPDFPLSPNSRINYHRRPWVEPKITVVMPSIDHHNDDDATEDHPGNDNNALKVLYHDEHMMAVHKPSGLPTMPSQTYYEYTVLNALRSCDKKFLAPPQPVHRLGVGTSGVLLIATSLEARNHLCAAIREKRVTKLYRALVENGSTIPDEIRIDCPIGPVPFPIGGDTIHAACPPPCGDPTSNTFDDSKHSAVKHALSLVRVIRRNLESDTAIVEVEIPTGRPHQIRIHMAYAGHPLVGDPLYLNGGIPDKTPKLFSIRRKEEEDMDTDEDDDDEGDNEEQGMVRRVTLPRDCGYSLHAYQISVEHPIQKGKQMTFTAAPPKRLV